MSGDEPSGGGEEWVRDDRTHDVGGRGPHYSLRGDPAVSGRTVGREGQGQAHPRPRRLQTRLHPHVTPRSPCIS